MREEVRDVWLTRWLRDFVYDLRLSARFFRRSPSFTATAVLSLALGIGATTAIYSLVDQVVCTPCRSNRPDHMVLDDGRASRPANGFGSYNLMSVPDLPRPSQQGASLQRRSLPRHDGESLRPKWTRKTGSR